MSATLNIIGQSILVAQNASILLSPQKAGPYRSVSQVDTVRAIFDRKDSFMILPTGYGKSLMLSDYSFLQGLQAWLCRLFFRQYYMTILYDSL